MLTLQNPEGIKVCADNTQFEWTKEETEYILGFYRWAWRHGANVHVLTMPPGDEGAATIFIQAPPEDLDPDGPPEE